MINLGGGGIILKCVLKNKVKSYVLETFRSGLAKH
jgi:hypothetical protein